MSWCRPSLLIYANSSQIWSIWELQAHSYMLPPQVLFAKVDCLSGLVYARGIKHLALRLMMQKPNCGHLSSAMSGLVQLETLWLGGSWDVPDASGALQLSSLCSLRSLALTSIMPESISCNDSCELHVEVDVDSVKHPVWDTVLPCLRSLTLFGNCVNRELLAMPSILLEAGNLTRAVVDINQCGTATAPLLLGGSLAHVEELVLDCMELHAVVPARVTWRNVYVAATHLNLRFEAVAPFGEAIPAFCFRFKELQVCYPQPSTGSWPYSLSCT